MPGHFRTSACLAAIVAFALGVTVADAQADRLDAGTFSILQNGQRVGREQFSLRKAPSPDGGAYELRAESTQGEKRTAALLTTDSAGSPIRYSVEIRDDAGVTVRLGGQRVRGRFATQSRRPQGESAREYLFASGALIVEADLFHQLCFVVRGRSGIAGETFVIPVLSPLENTQQTLRVVLEALNDSVTIAGVRRNARRWRMEDKGGFVRSVWADAEGRILRVVIPSRLIEAIRDEVPLARN